MKALHSFSFPWRRVLALFFAFLVCTALWAEATQAQLAEKVIRLHVLANSDSQADQTLKLQVRDKILAQTASLLSGQEIAARGYHYPVKVCLEETWFPTRQYENVSLPAGNYQALRVLIGEGAGKNWWCVVFPSLCLSAVTEESLQTAGLSHQEYALISEESQPYTIRFKAVEWWEACKHWFSRNES